MKAGPSEQLDEEKLMLLNCAGEHLDREKNKALNPGGEKQIVHWKQS